MSLVALARVPRVAWLSCATSADVVSHERERLAPIRWYNRHTLVGLLGGFRASALNGL